MTSLETLKTDWTQPTTGGAVNKDYFNKIGRVVNRKAEDEAAVHKTGSESIAGAKTFTSPVTVPTPTALMHAVTKQYVDSLSLGSGGGGSGGGVSTYEFEMDFTTKPVGAMPTTGDTGQPTWLTYNPTANAIPVISNPGGGSRYTIASTDNAARAGYYNVQLTNANVTYLSAKFEYGVGLQAWRDAMPVGVLNTAVQGSICHFGGLTNGWQYAIWNQSTGLAIVESRVYATTRGPNDVQTVAIKIDKAAGKAWVTGDDGWVEEVADSRLSTYDCKYACCEIYYNNASTEPRCEIYNFKATSATGGLPSGGSSGGTGGSGSTGTTNDNDLNIINVVTEGAKGDGVTDDSAAFLSAIGKAVAAKLLSFSHYGDPRGAREIYVPPGTYLIKQANCLIGDVGSGYVSGIKWRGAGTDVSHIVFQPTAANQSLAYNNDRFYHLTFADLSFHGDGANAATATLFDSKSSGHAQNYLFWRCNFGGTYKNGLKLTGTNNNSEMVFFACGIHGSMPSGAFLFSPSSGASPGGSDQFLNYSFIACNVEYAKGDFISMATGGNINVIGGSYIHAGDGNETTSTAQCFFKLLGSTHNAGSSRLHVQDIRVEHRHRQSQLIYCEWSRGLVQFDSVDAEIYAWLLTGPQNVIQSEYGVGANAYPQIRYTNCLLMGKQKFHYNTATYANGHHSIVYDGCEFDDPVNQYTRAADFFTFVNDSGAANPAGIPVVDVCGRSRATANLDHKEVFDTCLNWHAATNTPVTPKYVSVRPAAGGLPNSGSGAVTTATLNLPLNSIITRVRAFKGAGGASTATNVTYTLTDASSTQITQATTAGAAWNTAWSFDSGALRVFCNTDAKRQLTLTSANIAETTADLFFLVEYLG